MDIKARFRNKAFILSAVAFIVLLIKTFTKIQLPNNFEALVNIGLSLLVGLGIVVDPTTPGIKDKK